MKLALVVPGGVDRSGTQRVIPALLALIGRLARRHEVHVFAVSQEDAGGDWELCGARIHNVARRQPVPRALRAILQLNRGRPFDLVQSIWSGKCGFIAVTAARLLRRPSLVHVAGGELVAIPDIGYGGALRLRGRLVERFNLRGATVVTAASAPLLDAIRTLGVDAQRVPLGVDPETWPAQEAVPRPAGTARLIHVASLNRVKDQATLLAAAAILKRAGCDFHLALVGEDTLRGEIQQIARRLELQDRTAFCGFRPHSELRALMAASHVNVIASRHEAGPLAVLEAAMVGVPTVGTAVGHVAEWAPEAALSVPVRDPEALAGALRSLIEDEALRLRIARQAQTLALGQDADHTVRRFEAIYAALGRG